ncbi:MAG: helix-turn-helix transcriptional regulator [Nitrosomonas sp.]|nr:helix-turn-helix transcriptional regulator [Nitrosomonas sp.]MDP1950286.1 helix-turn-helix transcriptional regulator [Nitrosomonas sp.]
MIEIEGSSGNIYEDLQVADADAMHLKALLANKIADIIRHRHLTQQQAADILGISQSKLSGLLRGQFRGISETKMIECLNRLGRDVEIVIRKAPRSHAQGHTQVIYS